jgi:hypothetical protein
MVTYEFPPGYRENAEEEEDLDSFLLGEKKAMSMWFNP